MKYFRIFLCILLIFICCFSFLYGYKKIDEDKILKEQKQYKGIISLWQIDTFEGGRGSRKQFLLKIAREFERKNAGVLIMVSDMTIEGAKSKLQNGEYPDMISYGLNVEIDKKQELSIDNYTKGGVMNNKIYATAWCKGGYFLFRNKIKSKKVGYQNSITVLENENICPLVALNFIDKTFDKITIKPPLESYYSFVNYDCEYMLGTQRDIERLSKRNFDYEITPINGYNDLFQYISISSLNSEKAFYSEQFIKLLTSENSQKKLKDISMFSPYYSITFDNETLNNNQYLGEYLTISTNYGIEKITEIKNLSSKIIQGDKTLKGKIENLLI